MTDYNRLDYEFEFPYGLLTGSTRGQALFQDGNDPIDEVIRDIIDGIRTDMDVTIGDTTMHLAAWEDPDHWAGDWAEKLGVEHDDAPAAVWEILNNAMRSSKE